jgi:hypothetical protein
MELPVMEIVVMPVLKEWLLRREGDIAHDIEDLGDLRSTFIAVFGREPEKDAP